MLDENAPVSLQFQMKEILTQKIKSKEWPAGMCIPSEKKLCELFGVSRMTVREALKDLENEGYITRKQGKGTFVCFPKIEPQLNKFYSFSEETKKMGLEPSAIVTDFKVVTGDPEILQNLELQEGASVYKISRLRLAGEEIFAYEISYIPCSLTDKLTAEEIQLSGLYNTLQKYSGMFPDKAVEVFEAVLCPTDTASYLKVRKGSAVLKIERFARYQGICVEYCISMVRGDKFKYKIVLI